MVFGAAAVVGDTRSSRPASEDGPHQRRPQPPHMSPGKRPVKHRTHPAVPHRPGEKCFPMQLFCTQLSLMPHPSSLRLTVKVRGALVATLLRVCCRICVPSASPSRREVHSWQPRCTINLPTIFVFPVPRRQGERCTRGNLAALSTCPLSLRLLRRSRSKFNRRP